MNKATRRVCETALERYKTEKHWQHKNAHNNTNLRHTKGNQFVLRKKPQPPSTHADSMFVGCTSNGQGLTYSTCGLLDFGKLVPAVGTRAAPAGTGCATAGGHGCELCNELTPCGEPSCVQERDHWAYCGWTKSISHRRSEILE